MQDQCNHTKSENPQRLCDSSSRGTRLLAGHILDSLSLEGEESAAEIQARAVATIFGLLGLPNPPIPRSCLTVGIFSRVSFGQFVESSDRLLVLRREAPPASLEKIYEYGQDIEGRYCRLLVNRRTLDSWVAESPPSWELLTRTTLADFLGIDRGTKDGRFEDFWRGYARELEQTRDSGRWLVTGHEIDRWLVLRS